METRYIDGKECATLIRKALKKQFPEVKFSVRLDRYAGGCSINVYWIDGPLSNQVEPIIKQYQGGRFDGMIDLAYSVESYLLPDGTAIVARDPGTVGSMGVHESFAQIPPSHKAERVRFCVNHVFAERRYSAEMTKRAVAAVARKFGGFDPDSVKIEDSCVGGAYYRVPSPEPSINGEWLSTMIHRELVKRTNYVKEIA